MMQVAKQLVIDRHWPMIHGGWLSILVVCLLTAWLAESPGEPLTRNTVRVTLFWYAATLLAMMRLDSRGWRAQTWLGRAARWCWTWAWISFLVHLAMAFHFYDDWSHARAFARTRAGSGVGEGLYVSYLFTLGWTGDVLWWWLAPLAYAQRSRWVGRVWHAFTAFLFFNGTVVFEAGPIRWVGLALFFGLLVAWFRSVQIPTSNAIEPYRPLVDQREDG